MKNWNLNDPPLSLLTVGNPKTAKGEKLGYLTAILHLAPAKLSGIANVCAHASAGCEAACLNTAGRGGMGLDEQGLNVVQAARIKRTRAFKRNKAAFMETLYSEIVAHERTALRHGLLPCIRLNGTSDIPWENVKHEDKSLMDWFHWIQFYDYTKFPIKLRRNAVKLDNYHLSFSLSEANDATAKDALIAGVNVVAVFATKKKDQLPAKYMKRPVIDGDLHDLRFLDEPNSIVGLRAKGRGRTDESGFVRHVDG